MLYGDGRVRGQRDFLLEGVLVLRQFFFFLGGVFLGFLGVLGLLGVLGVLGLLSLLSLLGLLIILLGLLGSFLEPLVHLLQEGRVVVEHLHVQRTVHVHVAVVGDGVA